MGKLDEMADVITHDPGEENWQRLNITEQNGSVFPAWLCRLRPDDRCCCCSPADRAVQHSRDTHKLALLDRLFDPLPCKSAVPRVRERGKRERERKREREKKRKITHMHTNQETKPSDSTSPMDSVELCSRACSLLRQRLTAGVVSADGLARKCVPLQKKI